MRRRLGLTDANARDSRVISGCQSPWAAKDVLRDARQSTVRRQAPWGDGAMLRGVTEDAKWGDGARLDRGCTRMPLVARQLLA